MHRISLPGTDASLLVSPRWGELPPLLQVMILVLAFAVPIALVVLLYRYELRLIKPGAAIGLLALRLVVVVLILFLLGLQPVYARTHTEELPGRVLIADGGGLLQAIAARHKVELIGFTQEAWDANPDALADLFRPSEGDQARARAAFTDLRLPLSRALERSGSGEGKVLGVVLLS